MIEMGDTWCKLKAVFEVILRDAIVLGYRDFGKHPFIWWRQTSQSPVFLWDDLLMNIY